MTAYGCGSSASALYWYRDMDPPSSPVGVARDEQPPPSAFAKIAPENRSRPY